MSLSQAQLAARDARAAGLSCLNCGAPLNWPLGRRRPKYCTKSCAAINRESLRERPVKERLLERRHITETGCWEWTGAINVTSGYGSITIGNKSQSVPRVSFETFHRPLLPGECALHACDNPPCFNPDHLWAGTKGDNNRDCADKHRSSGFATAGGLNPVARLSDQQAAEVRALKAAGVLQKDIAAQFGVAEMVVSNIVTGKTYRGAR